MTDKLESIDKLINQIESLGYTVETFTNNTGTRFTYALWKSGTITHQSWRTWAELEPMYQYIWDRIPKPPAICQSTLYEFKVKCMGKVHHEGLHFATGGSGVHRFYLQWNSGVSWTKGQLTHIQSDIASRSPLVRLSGGDNL